MDVEIWSSNHFVENKRHTIIWNEKRSDKWHISSENEGFDHIQKRTFIDHMVKKLQKMIIDMKKYISQDLWVHEKQYEEEFKKNS